jgi:hypothetical protein
LIDHASCDRLWPESGSSIWQATAYALSPRQ